MGRVRFHSRVVGRVKLKVLCRSWPHAPHVWPHAYRTSLTHTHPDSGLPLSVALARSRPRTCARGAAPRGARVPGPRPPLAQAGTPRTVWLRVCVKPYI